MVVIQLMFKSYPIAFYFTDIDEISIDDAYGGSFVIGNQENSMCNVNFVEKTLPSDQFISSREIRNLHCS